MLRSVSDFILSVDFSWPVGAVITASWLWSMLEIMARAAE